MPKTIMTAIIVIVLLALGLPTIGLGQSKIDYSELDKVLKAHVKGTKVDYHALAEDHEALDNYVGYVKDLSSSNIAAMSEDHRLAFWINTFNALTLKAIIDAWPVMSIKYIEGYREKLWTVAGRPTTLDNIRMKYLGYDIGDPRAYLATCDGTVGSPPLKGTVYTPDKIQEQLDETARQLINDPEHIVLMPEQKTLEVNNNLFWFREFYLKKYPDPGRFKEMHPEKAAIMNFIEGFAEGRLRAELETSDNWNVELVSYLWLINSDRRPPVPMESSNPALKAPKKPTR